MPSRLQNKTMQFILSFHQKWLCFPHGNIKNGSIYLGQEQLPWSKKTEFAAMQFRQSHPGSQSIFITMEAEGTRSNKNASLFFKLLEVFNGFPQGLLQDIFPHKSHPLLNYVAFCSSTPFCQKETSVTP